MRLLITGFLLMSSMVFADTTDTRDVYVNSDSPSNIVELLTEKTRIEQRSIIVNTTCSRVEYQYRCYNRAPICRNECRNGYCRRVCYPAQRVCSNRPVTINYPCQRTEVRNVEVFDHYINTSVKFDFDFGSNNVHESIKLIATGNKLVAKSSTKDFAVYITNKNIRSSSNGSTVYKEVDLSIKYINAKKINKVIGKGIKNVRLNSDILSFELDKDFNFKDFTQNIKLVQDYRVGRDIILKEKNLIKADMMSVQVSANKKIMTLDLKSLIRTRPNRLRVVLTTEYNPLNYTLLNYDSLDTKTHTSWLFY